jgi:uracil-DNA glycosylase
MTREKAISEFGIEWYSVLEEYLLSSEFSKLGKTIGGMRLRGDSILPESEYIFRAFRETPYNKVTTIMCAQDPYSTKGVADGLAFSCSRSLHPQASLKNILLEIEHEYPENRYDIHDWRLDTIDLIKWARQGVLMLNLALTVEEKQPESHIELWKPFTQKIIEVLNLKEDVVYLLLGKKAQSIEKFISTRHRVVPTAHPAAEAYNGGKAGFFGSNCFKEVNQCLREVNLKEIIW